MTSGWYIIVEGTKKGPFNETQLKNLHATGQINGETLIWKEGHSRWLPIKQSIDLRPPPEKPYEVSSPRWFIVSRYVFYGVLISVILIVLISGLWFLNQWVMLPSHIGVV